MTRAEVVYFSRLSDGSCSDCWIMFGLLGGANSLWLDRELKSTSYLNEYVIHEATISVLFPTIINGLSWFLVLKIACVQGKLRTNLYIYI